MRTERRQLTGKQLAGELPNSLTKRFKDMQHMLPTPVCLSHTPVSHARYVLPHSPAREVS